nr:hypothetical protein [uncultured Pseudomonas sp.]
MTLFSSTIAAIAGAAIGGWIERYPPYSLGLTGFGMAVWEAF